MRRTRIEKDLEGKEGKNFITFCLEEGVYRCMFITRSDFILENDTLTLVLKCKEREKGKGKEKYVVKRKVFTSNEMEVIFDVIVIEDKETFSLDYLIERSKQYQSDPFQGRVVFTVREIFS